MNLFSFFFFFFFGWPVSSCDWVFFDIVGLMDKVSVYGIKDQKYREYLSKSAFQNFFAIESSMVKLTWLISDVNINSCYGDPMWKPKKLTCGD